MTYTVHVPQSDISFDCPPGTTILDAAKAAGYELPYSCRTGACGSCKGKILSGDVETPEGAEGLSKEERAAGMALFCQAKPCSDVDIGTRSITRFDPNAQKIVDAKIYRVTRVTDDISLLQLRFPAGTRVKFKAGQYLQVLLEDGERRSFSMANPPHQNDGVQLHVRHLAGGKFSGYLEAGPASGDIVKLELAFGDFYLREDTEKPIIFVASGTGFAPIKAMLEDAFKRKLTSRPMTLYWGGRRSKDLYFVDQALKWAQQYPHFTFVPVLSEPEEGWQGRTGFVHRAVMDDFSSLAEYEVYACGVPAMINAAREDFVSQRGLPSDAFFCDVFVPEGGGK
ncbi:MAG: flavin oxidoreductase [Herbaspirillum sp.]|jgi:NAD(P)H-flavin reductase/ferredoxin|nr:flavin oxidoreductase [Herbaspirillum sp.]